MNIKKTFYLVTLGCKVNQYESQAFVESWQSYGWKNVDVNEATVAVINTCAITAKAIADVRSEVRKIYKAAPHVTIIITGCATVVAREELEALPGVGYLVDHKDKAKILLPDFLHSLIENGGDHSPQPFIELPDLRGQASRHAEPEKDADKEVTFPPFSISSFSRSRAVVKIQDGCSHFCSYCIVPFARGKAFSRPVKDSLDEAKRLLEAGFREIVISGINLRQYTHPHHNFWDFVQLLEQEFASEWGNRARFRISSLEPGQLDNQALDTLEKSRLIAPQLHISLQSGSSSVLARMNRGHYSPESIIGFLERLSAIWPVYGLGVDLISGFPGETDQEHADTVTFIKQLPLTYAHVFPYSQRPGTKASSMPDQIEERVKKQRAAALREIALAKKQAFLQQLTAIEKVKVALEGKKAQGVCEYYADCIFEKNSITIPIQNLSASLIDASPQRVENGKLVVRPLLKESEI